MTASIYLFGLQQPDGEFEILKGYTDEEVADMLQATITRAMYARGRRQGIFDENNRVIKEHIDLEEEVDNA